GVRCARHQFCRVMARALGIAGTPANVDLQIATHTPAQLLQRVNEGFDTSLCFRVVGCKRRQHTNPPHALGLLRARRERPCRRRAAEQCHELAPLHSITSSARASSVGGTSRPMILAVCRLMTISKFDARKIGKSPGFSPLSTRPVYMPAWRSRSVTLDP